MRQTPVPARSVLLFVLAGDLQIGGAYLVWPWLREGRAVWLGALGGRILFLYGVAPVFQPAHFGPVHSVYGGVLVVLSTFWGWGIPIDEEVRRAGVGSGTVPVDSKIAIRASAWVREVRRSMSSHSRVRKNDSTRALS